MKPAMKIAVKTRQGQPNRTLDLGHYPTDWPDRAKRGKPASLHLRSGRVVNAEGLLAERAVAAIAALPPQVRKGYAVSTLAKPAPPAGSPAPAPASPGPDVDGLQHLVDTSSGMSAAELLAEAVRLGVPSDGLEGLSATKLRSHLRKLIAATREITDPAGEPS